MRLMSPVLMTILVMTTLIKSDDGYDVQPRSVKKKWQLFFKGVAYNNVDLYEAYVNGAGIAEHLPESCKRIRKSSSSCRSHYRNNAVLDRWDDVTLVRFSIHKNDEVKQFIVFNAEHSDYMHWFSPARIENSSWPDLRHQIFQTFSIEGSGNRKFLIWSGNTRPGCDNDAGYFAAFNGNTGKCSYDNQTDFPVFSYSKLGTSARFNSMHFADADFIAISVMFH